MVLSSWKTRGWTFQEFILSKRCVFFTETQTYYQCRSGYFTENFDGERVRHARAIGAENPFERTITDDNAAYSSKFNIYESLVKQYSSRKLSYPSDSLNAFSGILAAFSHSFGWRFISALPQDAMDLAILWRPLAGGIELHPRHKARDQAWPWQGITPTWCWTSWAGNVFWDPWRLHSYCGKEVSILPDIEQFFVWDSTGLRDIRGHQKSPSRQPIDHEQFEMQKHLSNIRNSVGEWNTDITCQPLLVFRATVFNLSLFSISLDHLATRWDQKYLAWIYDNDHHHCGTLYGANTDWPRDHDVPSCELILLSRCRQEEITAADIDEHRHELPPEYLSSSDYYRDVFDTSIFEYAEIWAINVMLIESKGEFSRRIAVGQMHSDALRNASGYTRIVTLT